MQYDYDIKFNLKQSKQYNTGHNKYAYFTLLYNVAVSVNGVEGEQFYWSTKKERLLCDFSTATNFLKYLSKNHGDGTRGMVLLLSALLDWAVHISHL